MLQNLSDFLPFSAPALPGGAHFPPEIFSIESFPEKGSGVSFRQKYGQDKDNDGSGEGEKQRQLQQIRRPHEQQRHQTEVPWDWFYERGYTQPVDDGNDFERERGKPFQTEHSNQKCGKDYQPETVFSTGKPVDEPFAEIYEKALVFKSS